MRVQFLLLLLLVVFNQVNAQLDLDLDSLKQTLSKATREEQIQNMYRIGFQFAVKYEFDSAHHYTSLAKNLHQGKEDSLEFSLDYLSNTLTIQSGQGRLEDAISLAKRYSTFLNSKYEDFIDQFDPRNPIPSDDRVYDLLSNNLNRIGDIYRKVGDYERSYEYFILCYKLVEKKDPLGTGMANVLNNLGILYDLQREYQQAIGYYRKASEINKKFGNPRKWQLASNYNNLGIVFKNIDQFDSAMLVYNLALSIMREVGSKYGEAVILDNVGLVNTKRKDFVAADSSFRRALSIQTELGSLDQMAMLQINIGNNYLKQERYEEAIEFGKKAYALAKDQDQKENLRIASELLWVSYDSLDQHDEAFRYLLENRALSDSLAGKEKTEAIANLKIRYETSIKDDQIKLQDAQLTQQTTQRNALLAGLGMLCVISLLIYRSQRIKTRINRQLRETEEIKTRWFVNVSHELKTPLTLVQGPLQNLLESEGLNEFQRKDLKMANRNLNQLNGLVAEILDLSKLQDGQLEIELHNTNLSALARTVVSSFESLARKNKVKLMVKVSEEYWLEIDQSKIRKLLENLLSNAIKFTHEGGEITLKVKEDKEEIKLLVTDTGDGISQTDLPFVFDRFYQSANKKKSRRGGTGVGLSLSKEVAELHGGTLLAESLEGEGSTFTLCLPKTLLREPGKIEESIISMGDEAITDLYTSRLKEKPQLLLVEDNADMQSYVEGILKSSYMVTIARDGKDAIEKLRYNKVDIIVSDIMMPRMDGIELMKVVKKHKDWSQIPFIALTALNSEEERLQALRLGIDDYLSKPFNAEELLVRTSNLLQNKMGRLEELEDDSLEAFDDKLLRVLESEVKAYLTSELLSVGMLADKASMSESSLRRFLKKSTGFSPLDFIQEIKLQKAMELLEQRVFKTVKEVAAASGFDRSARFTTAFKKRYGKSPSDFVNS